MILTIPQEPRGDIYFQNVLYEKILHAAYVEFTITRQREIMLSDGRGQLLTIGIPGTIAISGFVE